MGFLLEEDGFSQLHAVRDDRAASVQWADQNRLPSTLDIPVLLALFLSGCVYSRHVSAARRVQRGSTCVSDLQTHTSRFAVLSEQAV